MGSIRNQDHQISLSNSQTDSIQSQFIASKKGTCVGKTKCGKGTKLIAITDKPFNEISWKLEMSVRLLKPYFLMKQLDVMKYPNCLIIKR